MAYRYRFKAEASDLAREIRAELSTEADADMLHDLAATWALNVLTAQGDSPKFPTRQALLRSVIAQHAHAVDCRRLPAPTPDVEGDQP